MNLVGIPKQDHEAVLERAAIMEYDGKMSREDAEAGARLDYQRRRNGQKPQADR